MVNGHQARQRLRHARVRTIGPRAGAHHRRAGGRACLETRLGKGPLVPMGPLVPQGPLVPRVPDPKPETRNPKP